MIEFKKQDYAILNYGFSFGLIPILFKWLSHSSTIGRLRIQNGFFWEIKKRGINTFKRLPGIWSSQKKVMAGGINYCLIRGSCDYREIRVNRHLSIFFQFWKSLRSTENWVWIFECFLFLNTFFSFTAKVVMTSEKLVVWWKLNWK